MNRRFALKSVIGGAAIAALAACSPMMDDGDDIVDIAVGNGNFNTLVAALTAADLVETLQGDGPFTVFAPTDAAFAALPAGTLDNLLLPENKETLQSILLYHVVPGQIMAADVIGTRQNVATVNGATVHVDGTTKLGVTVNGATVGPADIVATNGVVHVIDQVLLP